MARTHSTQTHERWLIPAICVIYGALVISTAFVIARNISFLRKKGFRKLPANLQDHAVLRGTVTALIILVPSLFWPVILAVEISAIAIAIARLASEFQQRRGRRLARRQTEQVADLERAVCNSRNGEYRQNGNEHDGGTGVIPVHSPAMAPVAEPPPVYTPYAPTAHHQSLSVAAIKEQECRTALFSRE